MERHTEQPTMQYGFVHPATTGAYVPANRDALNDFPHYPSLAPAGNAQAFPEAQFAGEAGYSWQGDIANNMGAVDGGQDPSNWHSNAAGSPLGAVQEGPSQPANKHTVPTRVVPEYEGLANTTQQAEILAAAYDIVQGPARRERRTSSGKLEYQCQWKSCLDQCKYINEAKYDNHIRWHRHRELKHYSDALRSVRHAYGSSVANAGTTA